MPIRLPLLVLLGSLLHPVLASAQATLPEPEPTTLHPGDAVRLQVWGREDLTGEFGIAADGTMRHPLFRRVVVAGVPVEEAEARVGRHLEQYQASPQYVFEPLLHVGVGGEVREPGLYPYPPEVTLAQAVARAGGPTAEGRLDEARLVRGGVEYVVDLQDPEVANATVRSGDQIVLPARRNILRDYVGPASSFTAGFLALLNLIIP